jgi:hypothetical protein
MNGIEVNYKLGREVAAKMAVVGFAVPVLNPKTANKRHAEMWEQTICDGDELAGRGIALEY